MQERCVCLHGRFFVCADASFCSFAGTVVFRIQVGFFHMQVMLCFLSARSFFFVCQGVFVSYAEEFVFHMQGCFLCRIYVVSPPPVCKCVFCSYVRAFFFFIYI